MNGAVLALASGVMLPPAATSSSASSAAPGAGVVGSWSLSKAANASAGDSLFEALLQQLAAATSSTGSAASGSAGSGLPGTSSGASALAANSKPQGNSTGKSSQPQPDSQQALPIPVGSPDPVANPLLLGLLNLTPVPSLPSSGTVPKTETTIAVDSSAPVDKGTEQRVSVPAPMSPPASAPIALATQSLVSDPRFNLNGSQAPGETRAVTPPTNATTSDLKPMQPVFSLAIRSESAPQTVAAQPGAAPENLGMPQSQPPGADANIPQSTTSQAPASNGNTPVEISNNVAATSNVTPTLPQNNASGDPLSASPDAVPAMTSMKPDWAGSNSGNKPNDDQAGDKQFATAVIDAATPSGAALSDNKFQLVEARPVTEYAASEQATSTHANSPVTDIRLQLEGATNQHVNVRVIQEADGLRVSVRSNDPALTQSLQERVPELTTRLEQHHYQADVLLPERNDPGHAAPAHSGTNLQQDSSNRNQGWAGQGNPQNKQNQQQREHAWDEQDKFSSLLA